MKGSCCPAMGRGKRPLVFPCFAPEPLTSDWSRFCCPRRQRGGDNSVWIPLFLLNQLFFLLSPLVRSVWF